MSPPVPPASAGPIRLTLTETVEADELAALLTAARAAVDGRRGVTFDCSAAPFLPTGAVQLLFAAGRACRARGLPFSAAGVQPPAAAYLRLAGLGAALGL
ncbi:STAS domain-containing protein [Gemmata sp. JC717]|uniref:STAS domain-containing protein n=1 Tax=Gemmata algarum TaxID=2975278 RepID=A0ABU5ESM1_9BACT|nr:STAS domain-containing protein [Gemmata algarum]MDY3556017.1 STAS domain-containing protein [Gemmata algarum]MDY3557948.1 STAS domain-containing protein [Gemmata algarum]